MLVMDGFSVVCVICGEFGLVDLFIVGVIVYVLVEDYEKCCLVGI